MAVFRVDKNRNYTVMSNYHLRDTSLSLKAIGLLSKMLSLTDEWDYTTRGLAAICKEGVDAIGAALKELEIRGYLVRRQLRDARGRITDTEYTIYEQPHTPLPGTACPDTEKPDMDSPDTDTPYPEKTTSNSAYPMQAKFSLPEPILWTSETPYLYILVLRTPDEVICDRVGIREISIVDRVVRLNDQPIKFHGVNRHESDPVTGFCINVEQMKKDLRMMKAHNFNAIRTSHYPDHPVFYQLCDEYGFYVIDEADNESHGPAYFFYQETKWDYISKRWNEWIADNPAFIQATLDRTQRLVCRDKNRPCVLIWSMGNESA